MELVELMHMLGWWMYASYGDASINVCTCGMLASVSCCLITTTEVNSVVLIPLLLTGSLGQASIQLVLKTLRRLVRS